MLTRFAALNFWNAAMTPQSAALRITNGTARQST